MERYSGVPNYDQYKENQVNRTTKKWGSNTFNEIEFVDSYKKIADQLKNVNNICCLGIRNGNEYFAFKKLMPHIDVYGVDINPKVVNVGKYCYCYDFNSMPEEWENKFDLTYSNSLDHAFEVEKTIQEWHRITKNGGMMWLAISICGRVCATDLYTFCNDDIPQLFPVSQFEVLQHWQPPSLSIDLLLKVIKP